MSESQRESVNRAVLKFDPDTEEHEKRLRGGAVNWWSLSPEEVDTLVKAWKGRPKLEKRVNLSRRAVQNLLPYLRKGLTVTEARQRFAEDPDSPATPEQRVRYAFTVTDSLRAMLGTLVGEQRAGELFRIRGTTKADRHFIEKHPDLLPPAPMLANPVVRKAIHEVRRHVIEYLRKFRRKPDRVVIEFARSTKQSGKVRQAILDTNRRREAIRKNILEEVVKPAYGESDFARLSLNQREAAVARVILCRQQKGVCPYSVNVQPITELQAAKGTDVEIDHIVPYSRCGDNSLNNKILCRREANRGKGSKTPKEWLSEDRFDALLKRFVHFEKYKPLNEFFTRKDYARKWENLTREIRPEDEWKNSQLTDTAYAAVQVAQYLQGSLYAGETDGRRRVFETKGRYTAMLRDDWKLFDDLPGARNGQRQSAEEGEATRAERELQSREKDRGDHRQHAIDAIVIALTDPELEPKLAQQAAAAEEYHDRTGRWADRTPQKPPWEGTKPFRDEVLDPVRNRVVSHRPVKRKIVGALHQETPYGRAKEYPGLYSFRMSVRDLQPSHLRPPKRKVAKNGEVTWSIEGRGQGSTVRDPALRKALQYSLKRNGKDPDRFTDKDLKELTAPENYRLRMPSGVPIYTVRMVRTLSDPIDLLRSDGVRRFHLGGNNHHVEIREDAGTGKWHGEVVRAIDAARRVCPRKNPDGTHPPKRPPVDRSDRDGKRFVMSLAEGEMIYARRNDRDEVGYFVVCKLDRAPDRIHFAPHWDARPASEQDRWSVTPSDLKNCEPTPGGPPVKVRVSPLGDITVLAHD